MGSVLVGRMILEAILHRLRKRESWGGCSPPICLHDGFLKQFWLMVRRSRKQICAAQKRKAGELGGGGAAPPIAHTTSLSHVLKGAIWVLLLLTG